MTATPISEIPLIRDTLRASFRKGLTRPIEWRKHQLYQLARMLQDNAEAFADALGQDLGKPRLETYGFEIGAIVERILLTADRLDDWAKPTAVNSACVVYWSCLRQFTRFSDWQKPLKPTVYKAAKGTVLIIAPWNFPVVLSLQPLIGAIAAGCCAVLKPSEISPHFSALVAELFPKYLDPNAYRVVLAAVPETTKLLELQWDHIFYTGNARVARIISAAAAKHLTPLTLELGGKSPAIVDPSCDINLAAKRILWAKSHNCGQLCVAPDYVVIPRSHQEAFVSATKEWYAEFFPEGSMQSSSISRIVSPEHHARLMDLLKRSKGKVIMGGQTEGNTKIEITVLKDVPADDSFMDGEIFGPFLPIVPVDNFEDAIEFVRDRDHPLVLYAFTENPETKKRILDETMSGTIVFNDLIQQLSFNELPFGGVGQSGYGRQMAQYTFDAFSYERAGLDVPNEVEPFNAIRYPPYNDEKFKIMSAGVFSPIPSSS
ncbi:Aldehyde dehydrogenase [Mycena sanguinolenta]|uniref:Aldehyde dehydrogenase n=1 Tax=Mycena sanguinolenta TaxID=230812 RepID=A0A8H7CIM4_9AGAR|nr:Aldehyde dehydrogenase [Mycena sanguinolenta]